jgi:aerobic carbon-monoxide dehydrogenase small subunit
VKLTVNGRDRVLELGSLPGQVDSGHTLAQTLRETLHLTGTKISCDRGACGSCTVIVDGRAVLSCTLLTVECEGARVTTVEGLASAETGRLDPLQESFVEHTAFQCGFCTPGILMTARALLDENPRPSQEEVREALAGNFCRCITHYHVLEAVEAAVRKTAGPATGSTPEREA